MKKRGAGDCCDATQTDKVSDRDCGRGCSRQKGQGDPACGWAWATRTSKNVFEKSNSKTQYFVREVKGRRMTKNGVEFQIGWRDFPLDKDDTWEPITNLPGSEHMIVEFHRNWEEQYKIKTSEQLQSVIDKRNTRNEKNTQTQHEKNTDADMDIDETRADGDDDDEGGNSEDEHGEYEDGSGSAGFLCFLCHQPMNPSKPHTSVSDRTCRTGGSQTCTRTGKVFFSLHHYLTLAPNLSASVTTNTSPHRGNPRVTVFLPWN